MAKAVKRVKRQTTTKPQVGDTVEVAATSERKMRRPSNKVLFVLVLVVVVAALAYKNRNLLIVADVNGKLISRFEVWSELEKQGGKQVLDAIVSKELVMQEAAKNNVTIDEAAVTAEIKGYEDSVVAQGQTLDQVLALQGDNRAALTERVRFRIIATKLLGDKLAVTDQEVTQYMEDNKAFLPTDQKEEDIKATVKQQLEQQKLSTELQSYIDGLRAKAKINYLYNF